MQQRYQLAIQQAYATGGFLAERIAQHPSQSMLFVPLQRSRGRPNCDSILDILDRIDELKASPSSLQDQFAIFPTVLKFPLLNYVTKPMDHFVSGEVCSAIINLPARIHLHDHTLPPPLLITLPHLLHRPANPHTVVVSSVQHIFHRFLLNGLWQHVC